MLGRTKSHGRPSDAPHLLLFAWTFPPENQTGAHRPAAVAKYAARAGWKVTVIAGPLQRAELDDTLDPRVRVFRAEPALAASYRLLPKVDGGFPQIVTAHRAAMRACRDDPPTVVLASGPPFMIFISAYFAARCFGVPLALDYRDEWTIHTPRWVSVSAFDKKWEPVILDFAETVFFANEIFCDLYVTSNLRLEPTKCVVIPNGWDPEDFKAIAETATPGGRLVLAYVGTSGPHTDPLHFLEQVEQAFSRNPLLKERVSLRFVGPKHDRARESIAEFAERHPNSLENIGPVTKREAVAEVQRAGALLLLLDSPRGNYTVADDANVPAKAYEYLAAGAPILAFGPGGKLAELVEQLGAGRAVPTSDVVALEHALMSFLDEPRARWNTSERRDWIARYTREALSLRMLAMLAKARNDRGADRRLATTRHNG